MFHGWRPYAGLLAALLTALLAGCQTLGVAELDHQQLAHSYVDDHSRFHDIGGTRVHVHEVGEGPTLVLVHGILSSLHTWDGWVDRLAGDYRILRLDVPPFGLSGAMGDDQYHAGAIIDLLDAVLDLYEVDSAVLVGNSLGGYYAAYYAAHAPARVDALVLISPAAYPQPLPAIVRLGATPGIGRLGQLATPRPVVAQLLRQVYGDPSLIDAVTVQRYHEINRAAGNRAAARKVFREMARQSRQEPEWIRRIGQPTLLLWGEADRWVSPQLAQRWLQDLPDVELVLYPGVGHMAMEEQPAATAQDLRRFLERQATAPPAPGRDAEHVETIIAGGR